MVRVGKIVAAHGLQGSVILRHVLPGADWLQKGHVLFLELKKGSFIPYFVESAKVANDTEYIVTLDELADPEEAKKLIGKQAYAKEENLQGAKADSPLLWIGFNLVDKQKGGLGVIDDVMQAGAQWIAKVLIEEKEVLIPLVKEMIVEVNMRNKFIRMDLPEGLIDVYLES